MNFNKNLTIIQGDASSRKFYRKKNKKKSTIIIYSKKNKIKNLLNYDSINKILIKKEVLAPKLISENFKENFIEIQDLGEETLHSFLKKSKKKNQVYKKILIILKKIQNIKIKKIKNFKKNFYKIPIYSKNLLFKETELFLKWYTPHILTKRKVHKVTSKLEEIIKNLLKKIKLSNNTFVHRDFHVSNLMFKKNNIYVIDSQDAVYGNIAYDLASLIDDVRFKTSKGLKNKIYQNYLNLNKKKINKIDFNNDFQILSVLRNLKIIGIFTRLAIRDKKVKYLKLIPNAWKLIELRINNNFIFDDLKKCLDENFNKKIRKNEN